MATYYSFGTEGAAGFGGTGGSFGANPNKGAGGGTRVLDASNYDTLDQWIYASFGGRRPSVQQVEAAKKQWANTHPAPTAATSAPASAAVAPAASGTGPQWGDISGLFREALSSLSGDAEKSYQQGKRRSLADIAMNAVNTGMANTLNMPAANIAYDEANRPAFNTMLGQQKANILTGLGQTAAGVYGQNLGAQTSLANAALGAQTSRYATDVGAQTSLQTANIGAGADLSRTAMGMQTNQAQLGLEKYKADLEAAGRKQGWWNRPYGG